MLSLPSVLVLDEKFNQTTALGSIAVPTKRTVRLCPFIDGDRANALLGGPTRVDGLALHQRGRSNVGHNLDRQGPNTAIVPVPESKSRISIAPDGSYR
jgi:hypothetical protein